jgi:TorA maturation chaperone TorD
MAKEAKAQNAVADSSYYLGKLFEEKGDKERAITYYQSYFEAAKSEKPDKKDRRLVDQARVTFAISKANKNINKYIGLFEGEDSLHRILEWKIKRILK